MYIRQFIPRLFGICLLVTITCAGAQTMDLDIINLKHRNADEVINLIQPFLIPEASVTSRGYKLIIKSTPENLEEIRKVIAEFDTDVRQLKITVAVGNIIAEDSTESQASVQVKSRAGDQTASVSAGTPVDTNTGSIVRGEARNTNTTVKAQARVKRTTTNRNKPVYQTLTTLEGNWANIQTGQSVPIMQTTRNPDGTVTQSLQYKRIASGFSIRPRLQPNGFVLIDIRPFQNTLSKQGGGKIDTQSIVTTIEGRQNEWIELGGFSEISKQQTRSIAHRTNSRSTRSDSVHVKIEVQQ